MELVVVAGLLGRKVARSLVDGRWVTCSLSRCFTVSPVFLVFCSIEKFGVWIGVFEVF